MAAIINVLIKIPKRMSRERKLFTIEV